MKNKLPKRNEKTKDMDNIKRRARNITNLTKTLCCLEYSCGSPDFIVCLTRKCWRRIWCIFFKTRFYITITFHCVIFWSVWFSISLNFLVYSQRAIGRCFEKFSLKSKELGKWSRLLIDTMENFHHRLQFHLFS